MRQQRTLTSRACPIIAVEPGARRHGPEAAPTTPPTNGALRAAHRVGWPRVLLLGFAPCRTSPSPASITLAARDPPRNDLTENPLLGHLRPLAVQPPSCARIPLPHERCRARRLSSPACLHDHRADRLFCYAKDRFPPAVRDATERNLTCRSQDCELEVVGFIPPSRARSGRRPSGSSQAGALRRPSPISTTPRPPGLGPDPLLSPRPMHPRRLASPSALGSLRRPPSGGEEPTPPPRSISLSHRVARPLSERGPRRSCEEGQSLRAPRPRRP